MTETSINEYTEAEIDEWVHHYLVAALWSSTYCDEDDIDGNDPRPIDDDYGVDDVTDTSRAEARADILDFIAQCTEAGIDLRDFEPRGGGQWSLISLHAHDLWLNRNGHGCGFWDRGYGEVGERLSDICHHLGGIDPYVHDGRVYVGANS